MDLRLLEIPPLIHGSIEELPHDPRQVHLYLCDLDAEAQRARGEDRSLSEEERQRAERLSSPLHRRRFVAGRVLLRRLLGLILGLSPRQVVLDRNAFGKPVLSGHRPDPRGSRGLHFNVSHCEHVWVAAVTRLGEVGVDVEIVRPEVDVDALAADHLSPAQVSALRTLSADRKVREFYRFWTLNEAVVKADGTCIALGSSGADAGLSGRCASCPARSHARHGAAHAYRQLDLSIGNASLMVNVAVVVPQVGTHGCD